MDTALKHKVVNLFSIHGFTLRRDAMNFLLSKLSVLEEHERSKFTSEVLNFLQTANLTSSFLEKCVIEEAVQTLEVDEADENLPLNVVDSFNLPAYYYHVDTKKFILQKVSENRSLFGRSESLSDIYIEKYKMIYQRTVRHPLFAPPAIVTDNNKEHFSLKSVEHLLGASTKQANLILLGMLTQLKEGQFWLEDPTGAIRLNLSQASYKGGLFTENNIILAEGFYEDSIFHVTAIGFPPPEPASVTLSHFHYLSIFKNDASSVSFRLSEKLKHLEEKHSDSMFIILSDVWLDQIKVMQKLQILFAGYSQFPPYCFILIGNFLSSSSAGSNTKHFQECFEKLGSLISEFPTLTQQSTFIFVPGPDDPGLPHILPRPRIPESLLKDFQKKVPTAIFTSNPCRVQYCTQEIVIFREDIISKMCRNTIYTPWEHEEKVDIPSLFVKTIIANGHFLPLPLNVAPIYWEYDHAFWLYPLPDVMICADKCDPYSISSTGCVFFNPGSFPRTKFQFKVYVPSSKQVEDSQITDEFDD